MEYERDAFRHALVDLNYPEILCELKFSDLLIHLSISQSLKKLFLEILDV